MGISQDAHHSVFSAGAEADDEIFLRVQRNTTPLEPLCPSRVPVIHLQQRHSIFQHPHEHINEPTFITQLCKQTLQIEQT